MQAPKKARNYSALWFENGGLLEIKQPNRFRPATSGLHNNPPEETSQPGISLIPSRHYRRRPEAGLFWGPQM